MPDVSDLERALDLTAIAAVNDRKAWQAALELEHDALHAWLSSSVPDALWAACTLEVGRVSITATCQSGGVRHTFKLDGHKASRQVAKAAATSTQFGGCNPSRMRAHRSRQP